MPPLRDLDQYYINHYIGGEIIFPTVDGSSSLVKGEVMNAYFEDEWLIVTVRIQATAEGELGDADTLDWKQLSRGVQELSLSPTAYVDDKKRLSFPTVKKGSLAIIKHP